MVAPDAWGWRLFLIFLGGRRRIGKVFNFNFHWDKLMTNMKWLHTEFRPGFVAPLTIDLLPLIKRKISANRYYSSFLEKVFLLLVTWIRLLLVNIFKFHQAFFNQPCAESEGCCISEEDDTLWKAEGNAVKVGFSLRLPIQQENMGKRIQQSLKVMDWSYSYFCTWYM